MIWDAIMTQVDVREADRVGRRDWMIGDQPPRSLDFIGNLITERLDLAFGWGSGLGAYLVLVYVLCRRGLLCNRMV